jgi:hypothetical protein
VKPVDNLLDIKQVQGREFMSVGEKKQSEQALEAIVNLFRYKRQTTSNEADERLRLINQIAVDPLRDGDKFHDGKDSQSLTRCLPAHAAYIRSQRLLRQKSLN